MKGPKTKLSSMEFGEVDGRVIELAFDDDVELPFSKEDRALGALTSGGLPVLLDAIGEGQLPAVLAAVDPTLKLSEIDAACGKLEDLAILILTAARGCRHENAAAIAGASPTKLAAHQYGANALNCLDFLAEFELLEPDEIETNRRLLRSASSTARSKPSRQ